MKLSFWDILASMVMLAGLALATIFVNIFVNPYTLINPFPPATPIATLVVPTFTASPQSLPELWTATPETPVSNVVKLVSSSATATQIGTHYVLPTATATRTRTASPTSTKTVTSTPNRTLTAAGIKTATKTSTSVSNTSAPVSATSTQSPCSTTSGYCDDVNPSVFYTGNWSLYSGSGPYNSTSHYSSTAGSTASFAFNGTKITYVFPTYYNRGHAKISIDGGDVANISLYSSGLIWQQMWDSNTLTDAIHTITVTVMDGTVDLDAFIVERVGPAITNTPAPTNTQTSTSTPTSTSTMTLTSTATETLTPTPTALIPPTNITISASSVAENMISGTTVGFFTTTDPDNGTPFTYSFSTEGCSGTDNGAFSFSGANLVTNSVFDYETKNSYDICVRTTDSGGSILDKSFTITINDVNEAPYDIALSSSTIYQGNPIDTAIGNFSTSDVDSGDTFTYSLVNGGDSCSGPDNGNFAISGNLLTNRIVFGAPGSYTICVQSSDSGSLTTNKPFTISIQPFP